MLDVVIAGDFTLPGDIGVRVAGECRVQWDLGLRTGLLQIGSHRVYRRISPDVQRCVREGLAEVVDLAEPVRTPLLVVHIPTSLGVLPENLVNLDADRVVFVHERAPVPQEMWRLFGLARGRVSHAPTNRWVRAAIAELRLPLMVEEMDWRPALQVSSGREPPRRRTGRLAIGYIDFGDRAHWPETSEALTALLPIDGSVEVHLLGRPPSTLLPQRFPPNGWTLHEHEDIGLEGFLDGVDALVYAPSRQSEMVPDAAIAIALARERLVATLPHLRPHLGEGPIYGETAELLSATVASLREGNIDLTLAARARLASFHFSPQFHREHICQKSGVTQDTPRRPAVATQSRRPRALFVASNGVGLGHVTRLLAIANRAAHRFDPVFVSHAQAVPVIRGHGYATEYIPSLSDTLADPGAWDAWLRAELERLIFTYDCDALVFDGNNPTLGLIRAALSQPPCRLVWVRRGMAGPVASPHLDNSRYFDLIIEPGEIAAERDTGATAARRHEVLEVDPVTLLDPADLLDRQAAMGALGLDPSRPTVLVQLGAGAHRDIVSLIDAVVTSVRTFHGVQVVIAEWANSSAPLSLWPDTAVVASYPLGKYLNAFDFCISAAGYNTFHEAMAFGIPTIFIATTHVAVDDQRARARYAQDMGAALEVGEDELFRLAAILPVMLDARARNVIRQNCAQLRRPNGASAAADAIARLLERA
jgi:UDP:flavonoid glycosyltransferase YjiC (YdhE family)